MRQPAFRNALDNIHLFIDQRRLLQFAPFAPFLGEHGQKREEGQEAEGQEERETGAALQGLVAGDAKPGIGEGAGDDAEEGAEGVGFEVNGGEAEEEVDGVEGGDGGEADGEDKQQGFAGNGLVEASEGAVVTEAALAPVAQQVTGGAEGSDGSEGSSDQGPEGAPEQAKDGSAGDGEDGAGDAEEGCDRINPNETATAPETEHFEVMHQQIAIEQESERVGAAGHQDTYCGCDRNPAPLFANPAKHPQHTNNFEFLVLSFE